MYEWEKPVDKDRIAIRIMDTQKEIKRICEVTLRGNFSNPEDGKYWEKRLDKLNGELRALESM